MNIIKLSVASALSAFVLFYPLMGVSAYCQEPRCCLDPRTQYPSNPPC